MILFLDFDGVLHPVNRLGTLFMWVPRLAAWLVQWPEVAVVISSSWRTYHPQRELVELLGPVIGARVVGSTPLARLDADDQVYPAEMPAPAVDAPWYERQSQVIAWMATSWDPHRPWVALDDMPDLFEPGCAQLVTCVPRNGLSAANLDELSRHAVRAGLARAPIRGFASKESDPAHPAGRRLTVDKYLKHSGSCLPDSLFQVTVDPDGLRVTIAADAFDSSLVGWLVTRILPEEFGIVAYREDDAGWNPPPAPYDLRLRIGANAAVEFEAQVVRLSSAVGGGIAVHLSEPIAASPMPPGAIDVTPLEP